MTNIMQIIIMRHGDAEPFCVSDKQRNLTSCGEQEARQAGTWLQQCVHLSEGIGLALVSPYNRAQQSYQLLSQEVKVARKELSEDIVPCGNAKLVHDYLDLLITQDTVKGALLIVSHMPFISYLLDELLGEKKSILFATSSCALIEYSAESCSGKLVEHYYPQC